MNFTFRPQLTKEVKSYASHTPVVTEALLDCSLGVNPYGFPPEVAEVMDRFEQRRLLDYPHSDMLYQALREYWKGITSLEVSHLTLANGSICGLYCLNNVFSQTQRREAVGFVPSFTDMVESVRNFGMTYRGVPMRLAEAGRADVNDLISALSDQTAFVYLDRPNNPTGQTLSLPDVEQVLTAARQVGAYVIVDEAYGDFIPRKESALAFWGRYDNLIVIKTFSKGFGLANLRGGYIVAPEEITGYLAKTSNPYLLSDLEREIFAEALRHPTHPTAHSTDFAAAKREITQRIGKRLTMLTTDERVPICTLALNEAGDLQKLLLEEGILTVSGVEFETLDRRFVRLRVPSAALAERLILAIERVEIR